MNTQSLISPEDQSVTFIELFFDLVFVFAITQIVGLFHGHITWGVVGESILLFWIVWWAWTQFSWALNSADTTHQLVETAILIATGVAFFMAVAVPFAFEGRPLAFALPYVIVRGIGLILYIYVTLSEPEQNRVVRQFALLSVLGLSAVLVGAILGGPFLYAFWGVSILLDIVAASVGGAASTWNLHPEHFTERHGLIVIIALGETLIVAASGVTSMEWSGALVGVGLAAVAATCLFWWSYFPQAKPTLDQALETARGHHRSEMARDVFSLFHFPMLCGVIAYAVAIEEAIVHPDDPLSLAARWALAVGLVLFLGGIGLAVRRATSTLPLVRIVLAVIMAGAVVLVADVSPLISLLIVVAGTLVIVTVEHFQAKPRGGLLAQPTPLGEG